MMVRMAETGDVHAVDYRGKAQAASSSTMFLGEDGEVDRQKSGVGYFVIGVPVRSEISGKPCSGSVSSSGAKSWNPLCG